MDIGAGSSSDVEKGKNDGEKDRDTKGNDHYLPIANVGRIMKNILPPDAKISKDAKQMMQECVSEFILFVTGEASEKRRKEKRKTLNGDDICWALGNLALDDHAKATIRYLEKYRVFEYEREEMVKNREACLDNDLHL